MMTSRLVQMQARFQQKQIEAREEKLLKMYESQQQKAIERVSRGSAGSNTSLGSTGGGKVRQMFDERRKAGIDKSYPLEPLKGRNKTVKTVQKTTKVKQTTYNNNNGKDEMYQQEQKIVELMNDHNLYDSIENEEMPIIEPAFVGKLSNLGGKLPSEKAADEKKTAREAIGKTFRKETKPIVKRTVKPALSPTSSLHSQPSFTTLTTPPSPASRSNILTMSAKKAPPQVPKAPSSAKPSAKQSGKAPVQRDDLTACRFCNRRFATDRLAVHENICAQNVKKKRKVYDATKHRLQGTELEQYARRGPPKSRTLKAAPQIQKQAPKKDWRRTHEDFINAIRAAKQAQMHVAKGGKLSDLPPPPPSSNPDYVQCPHCGRKFNEAAAERHIPKCASYQFNKPKPGAPPRAGKR